MKLLVHESLIDDFSPDRLILLSHYAKYCERALNIENVEATLMIVPERRKYGIETTGTFEQETSEVFIYGKNRSFVDILRSISHELVHVKQHTQGWDKDHFFLHFHSQFEDEANVEGMALLNAYSEVMGHDIIYEN